MKQMNVWVRAMGFGLVGIIGMLLLSAAAAKLIEGGKLPLAWTPVLAYGIIGLSALLCCLMTAFTCKAWLQPLTALTGGVYFLMLCILNGVLQRGEFQRLLPTAGIAAGAVLLSVILAAARGRSAAY